MIVGVIGDLGSSRLGCFREVAVGHTLIFAPSRCNIAAGAGKGSEFYAHRDTRGVQDAFAIGFQCLMCCTVRIEQCLGFFSKGDGCSRLPF